MKIPKKKLVTIEDYIQLQEKDKQAGLTKLKAIIKKVAPKATEGISYQMPVFIQGGNLVYFSATKNHYGFYPTAKPIEVFKKQLDDIKKTSDETAKNLLLVQKGISQKQKVLETFFKMKNERE